MGLGRLLQRTMPEVIQGSREEIGVEVREQPDCELQTLWNMTT